MFAGCEMDRCSCADKKGIRMLPDWKLINRREDVEELEAPTTELER
jgi:hypothetical protein